MSMKRRSLSAWLLSTVPSIVASRQPIPIDTSFSAMLITNPSTNPSVMSNSSVADEQKNRLIAVVKKEVKQIMEEAVTRKFVHEESGSVTSLCAAVEACLSQGLRRRALGLFKTSSTTALLHKIGKHCPEAADISQRVQEIECSDPNKRSSSSGDSTNKPPILKKNISSNSIIGGSTAVSPPVVRCDTKCI